MSRERIARRAVELRERALRGHHLAPVAHGLREGQRLLEARLRAREVAAVEVHHAERLQRDGHAFVVAQLAGDGEALGDVGERLVAASEA